MAAPSGFGNWQVALEKILEDQEKTKAFITFKRLTSNEDRVEFIFKNEILKAIEWLPTYFEASKKWHKKSSEVALVWKTKGNKFFQLKKYSDAVISYTESCLNAPVEKGEDLALSYGNRSAALFYLGQYKECVKDIHRALQNRFPLESLHKLLLRKTSAFVKLNQKEEAQQSYNAMWDFVNSDWCSLQGNKRDFFLKEAESLAQQIKGLKEASESEVEKKEVPHVSFGVNSIISQATDAVSFTYSAEKGRHLLANREITKGSTLIVERPFAAVLLPDHYETHCHHCFSSLPLAPVGCKHCTKVRFCQEECMEAAWNSYHQIECRFLDLFHSVGIAHLSFRVILQAGRKFLADFLKGQSLYRLSEEPGSLGLNKCGCYDRSYVTVYDLMTHEDNTGGQDMLQYSLTAGLLLTTLAQSQFFNETDSTLPSVQSLLGAGSDKDKVENLTQELKNIGGLLLRHILQLVCNAHAITGLQAFSTDSVADTSNNTQDLEQVRIATAIYPSASLMNHSCDPTIISSFVRDVLVVRTVKDVEKGEEIFNCYGPHFCRMRREERQEVLKSQYHFECVCPPCRRGDVMNLRFNAFKCPICAGILNGQSCVECGQCIDNKQLASLETQASEALRLFKGGVTMLKAQNFDDAIKLFKGCQEKRQGFLYKDHKDLALTDDAIARCYASKGDYSTSADYLFKSITFSENMYGDKSIEYTQELQKLAEVLFNAERLTECLDVSNRCLGLFESLCSPGHEMMEQVRKLRDETRAALHPLMETR